MRTTVIVIGAGQAGLAMSAWLGRRGIDHVVLERGEVANTWRRERWPTLTLLTPNWQTRLPGYAYSGDDPDGYLTRAGAVGFLEGYARVIAPPLRLHTRVEAVRQAADGYEVVTASGTWRARAVVLATGAFNRPCVPDVARLLPPGIRQLTIDRYAGAGDIAEGGVLVVGAAATGVQLADELQRAGRRVYLAVGEHVRVPRVYRGRDILWWLDATGMNDVRFDQVDDIERARGLPSFQLAGQPDRRDFDLNALRALGVSVLGRLAGVTTGGTAQFSGALRNVVNLADLKLSRLLNQFDAWAQAQEPSLALAPPHRPEPTRIEAAPPLSLDLPRHGIATVLWATGFRPDYSWLQVPVVDRKGRVRHQGGVVSESPGLYVLGLPFLRRRKSTLIDGVGDDARDLSAHIAQFLGGDRRATGAPAEARRLAQA